MQKEQIPQSMDYPVNTVVLISNKKLFIQIKFQIQSNTEGKKIVWHCKIPCIMQENISLWRKCVHNIC